MNLKNKKQRKLICYIVLSCLFVFISVVLFEKMSMAYWIEDENGKKYSMEDGSLATGFSDIDGNRYYFDADGYLITGKFYVEEEDTYYFADEEGIIKTGVIKTEKYFFVADESGKLQKGFVEYDGKRYYFDEAANLVTDWFKSEGNWYYADYTGAIVTGFLELDGYRYYMNTDGTRVSDTVLEIDGNTYIFNADGSIDENATTLYPVYQYLSGKRTEYGLSEIVMNQKVQACAILRASDLKNGYKVKEGVTVSVENLLKNRGIQTSGGFEFSYGGIEDYGTDRLIADLEKDLNLNRVLKDTSVTEMGIGYYEKDNIYYYDVIFITKE